VVNVNGYRQLGFGAQLADMDEEDYKVLEEAVRDYCREFNMP